MRMTRRQALTWLTSTTGVAVIAACSPAPQATAPTSVSVSTPAPVPTTGGTTAQASATQATTGQPKRGGTLRMGQVSDITRLDGQLVASPDTTWIPYDRLTVYDANLQPQPMLAESWEFSSDHNQLKLNLRKGVHFHSGREFTSDDVKWNIMHTRDPKVAAGALILQSKWYTSVETPDKYTVILGSDQPKPATFDFFEYFDIVDSDTADSLTTLIGTGPFKFVEWVQGDHLLFTRNADYWQSGLPYLEQIEVHIFSDGQAMVAQLEAGAIDVADVPPLPDAVRLANDPNYRLFTTASGTNVIGLNTTIPPTDNKLLRQALNYAIDRERIVKTVYSDTVTAECLPWEPNTLAFEPSKNQFYPYDPEKARSLLAQSGLTNLAFDLTVSAGSAQTDALAQLYQASLSSLGITLTIKPYQQATYLDQINNHKYLGAYIGGIAYAAMEPVTRMANSRHLDPSGNSNTGFTSAEYVSLFNQASAEPDTARRKQLYSQVNDLLLDESFVMPICNSPGRMMSRARVHDITPSEHGTFLFNRAWMDS